MMTFDFDSIERYAQSTLGETPKIITLLSKYDKRIAAEQFRENIALYLGRKNLTPKQLSYIAIAVSLSHNQKDSLEIHYKLAKRFGATRLEILDVLKATKIVLMSSTMFGFCSILPIVEERIHLDYTKEAINKIVENIRKDLKTGPIPENFIALSKFSFDLFAEHLKEKSELLTPFKLDLKNMYLIAFSVALSIRYEECMLTNLNQFLDNGGTSGELEDAVTTTRFIVGNRAMMGAVNMLEDLDSLP